MKKIICLALILVLCFSMTACVAEPGLTDQGGNAFGGFLEGFSWEGIFGGNGDQDIEFENMPENLETYSYMPDLINQDIFYVSQQLNELGISAETVYVFDDTYAENRVISQSIVPGTALNGGETVILTVSMGSDQCPYDYSQKVVVSAARGSSYASVAFYEWYDGDWQLMTTYSATVGSNGIGQAYEGSKRTPQGLYKLGVVLSSHYIDTNMNTYHVTSSTCVVDDPDSRYYNCIMDRSQIPYGTSYDQIGKGLSNGTHYAFIYIEHNGTGLSSDGVVAGAGSVMGIRGTHKSLAPTFGDVDISYYDMVDLLSRLDSTKNPMVELTTY